jgi:hypothetical protein
MSLLFSRLGLRSRQVDLDDEDYGRRQALNAPNHQPTRPVDKERAETELALSIKKATSPEETAPSKSLVRFLIFLIQRTECPSFSQNKSMSGVS